MALDHDRLETVLRGADSKAVVAFFERASEHERQACAKAVLAWCALLDLNLRALFSERARKELATREQVGDPHALLPAAHCAALACATLSQIKPLESIRAAAEDMVAILGRRQPPWADAFAEWLCERELNRGSIVSWQQVRSLVRAGVCRAPAHDHYVLAAIEGIWPLSRFRENQERLQRGLPPMPEPQLPDLLIAESDWLECSFWRLFEIDGTGEVSLANAEKYGKSNGGWREALVELSRRGLLSRERLLDASLAALARDFIQFRAGWFSRFHEAMQPIPAERAARIDAYLHLLASSIAPTVAFAMDAVAVVDAMAPLPAERLLQSLAPVLSTPGKTVARKALLLLDRLAEREPARSRDVCRLAVTGLLNETTDVQKLVFGLLDRHAAPRDLELQARLAEFAEAVAASLRPRLLQWLKDQPATPRGGSTAGVITAPAQPLSRIDHSRAIAPIMQVDDLLDLAGRVLETPESSDDIERLLDGISRLCDQRPDDFVRQAGPLRKRALAWRDRPAGSWTSDPIVHRVLAMVILSWIDRDVGFTETSAELAGGDGALTFLFGRLESLARQVASGVARPLLSAPTHVSGWIEPCVLVDRWLAWQRQGADPDIRDQVLALLRLAPENRAEAREKALSLQGEVGDAVRHALGDGPEPSHSSIWLAACRSAKPYDDLPALEKVQPNLGPDGGQSARYSWSASVVRPPDKDASWARLTCTVTMEPARPRAVNQALLPVLFHLRKDKGWFAHTPRTLVRWTAQMWPAHCDALFARSIIPLQTAVYWAEVEDRETSAYLELLTDSCTELRPMAWLALALGLAAQDPTLRGHAKEGLIAVVADGRLDPECLGATMSRLLDTGFNKLTRWSVSLGEVARISPLHARCVAGLVVRTLHGSPAMAPRDLGALLELLLELLSETGAQLEDPAARAYLAGLKAGGKAARLARQLLSLHSS